MLNGLICVSLALVSLGLAQAQLVDNFEDAGTLPSDAQLEIAVDFTQITAQIGKQPTFESPGSISVWGKWTAPSSGAFLMSSTAREDELSITAFTGDAHIGIKTVSENTVSSEGQLQLTTFDAVIGTTYTLQFELGFQSSEEVFTVSLAPITRPANDEFSEAIDLEHTLPIVLEGSAIGATTATSEASFERTLWWTWTVPDTSLYRIETNDQILIGEEVVTPEEFQSEVPRNRFGGVLHLEANTRLKIGLSADTDQSVRAEISRIDWPSLGNDSADTASDLGDSESISVSQLLERSPSSSVFNYSGYVGWWTWRSPFTGVVEMTMTDQTGNFGSPEVILFREQPTLLQRSYDPPSSALYFTVEAGESVPIRIAAESAYSPVGVAFALRPAPAPINDHFANATDLGAKDEVRITFSQDVTATVEPGEPVHGGDDAIKHSLWWRWTPATAGEFRIKGSQEQISVYAGTSLTSLTLIASDERSVSFVAVPGSRYYIASATDRPGLGNSLSLTQTVRHDLETPSNRSPEFATDLGNAMNVTFERATHANASVWWRWTAPSSGLVSIVHDGSLTLYEESVLTGNLKVEERTESAVLPVTEGVTYWLKMNASGSPLFLQSRVLKPFRGRLRMLTTEPLFNNTAEQAKRISQDLPAKFRWHDFGYEERRVYSLPRWWAWTAPADGFYELVTKTSLRPILKRGPSPDQLVSDRFLIRKQQHHTFQAAEGETVYMATNGPRFTPSFFDLALQESELRYAPDLKEEAIDLGSSSQIDYPSTVAFAEWNLEDLNRDVWFRWQAPQSGIVALTEANARPSFEIEVTNLASPEGPPIEAASFYVTQGEAFLIRVLQIPLDTPATFNGDFNLKLRLRENSAVYNNWLTTKALEPSQSSPVADPDRDGLNNLLELAFGSDPLNSTDEFLNRPQILSTPEGPFVRLHVSESINQGTTPLEVLLETSEDLQVWQSQNLEPGLIEFPLTSSYFRLRVSE